MRHVPRQHGFSLTEVLISLGILTVAMLFIAGVFPVSIHYITTSAEKSIAPVVADEAFAKIQIFSRGMLYEKNGNPYHEDDIRLFELSRLNYRETGGDWEPNGLTDFNNPDIFPVLGDTNGIIDDDAKYWEDDPTFSMLFLYPTTEDNNDHKQYCWSALLRLTKPIIEENASADPNRYVQTTVFVCRRPSPRPRYIADVDFSEIRRLPVPVKIAVEVDAQYVEDDQTRRLQLADPDTSKMVREGMVVVDNITGRIYKIVRKSTVDPRIIELNANWDIEKSGPSRNIDDAYIWAVPPPVQLPESERRLIGKSPCIGVFQKVIKF